MTCPRCGAQMYKNFSLYYNELWACSMCDYQKFSNNPPVKDQFNQSPSYRHRQIYKKKNQLPITLDEILDFHEKLEDIRI